MRPGPQEAEASSFEVQMLSRLEAIETALAHITAMPDRAQLDDLSTRPAHSDLAEPKCPEWKRVHAPRRRPRMLAHPLDVETPDRQELQPQAAEGKLFVTP